MPDQRLAEALFKQGFVIFIVEYLRERRCVFMSKEKLAEYVTVKWEDSYNTGWPVKQCTMSLNYYVKNTVDSDIYEMNEPEIKRHIQNKNLERIDRDMKRMLYPDIDEVINELNNIVRLMKGDNTFYKGEPLYHVLERLANKLT